MKYQHTYPLDLHSVARHTVTLVTDGGNTPPSVSDIAESYRALNTSDVARVIKHEKVADEKEAKVWMVRTVLEEMKRYIVVGSDDVPRYREGHSLETVRFDRRKVVPLHREEDLPWSDAFNPHMQAGTLANGIRISTTRHHPSDDELEESMREFGWIPHHPAIRDEYGVTLVGNRRLAVAEKLDIEPQIVIMRIGDGNAADAMRFRIAVGSNLGAKPLTPKERARLAEHLYVDAEWSVARIAQALSVGTTTVERDLARTPKRRGKTGRDPEWAAAHDPIILRWMAGEITVDEAVKLGKETGVTPCSKGTYGSRRDVLLSAMAPDATSVPEPDPASPTLGETGKGVSDDTPSKTDEKPERPKETTDPVVLAIRAARTNFMRMGHDEKTFRDTLLAGVRIVAKNNVSQSYVIQCLDD